MDARNGCTNIVALSVAGGAHPSATSACGLGPIAGDDQQYAQTEELVVGQFAILYANWPVAP
jgi:hypothetical protein